MSEDEKALALALDSAFLRDCDSTEGVRAASTPRLRLEAAQLLADKVGHDSHSPPSEANLMDEIFKGGSSSFSKLSSELDNKQTLDEMDKILENLQSWRNKHPEDGSSDVHMDSDSEEDEEYRVHLQLYQQHRNQHDDGDDKKQDLDEKEDFEEEEPLTARLANEHTMESLALLIQHGAKDYSDPDEEDVEDSKELEGRNRNSNNSSRLERDMLFRRIEQETRNFQEDSVRLAEEKVNSDSAELENDMSVLEAQLRGFGSELDHLLLMSDEEKAAASKK